MSHLGGVALPIYEYKCTKCSHQFELRRGFGEDTSAPCPRCKGEGRRLFSPVTVIFKGSGFYVTDNRAKNANLEENAGSKQDDNGSDGKGSKMKASDDKVSKEGSE